MPEYEIAVKRSTTARITIQARNLDEAIGKAEFLHETNCIPANLFIEDGVETYPEMLPADEDQS